MKIYIFVFVAGFPITIRLLFIFLGGREAGSRRPPYPHMVFVGNERTSACRQSPGCRFQPQRHDSELTPSDFNCFAIGNKMFQQGNANCLPAWPCRAGRYMSMIYRTPQPGFTVFTEGQDSKAPFNSRGIYEPVLKYLTASVVCSKTKIQAIL